MADLERRILLRLLTECDPQRYMGFDGMLDWTDDDRRENALVYAVDVARIAALEAEESLVQLGDWADYPSEATRWGQDLVETPHG